MTDSTASRTMNTTVSASPPTTMTMAPVLPLRSRGSRSSRVLSVPGSTGSKNLAWQFGHSSSAKGTAVPQRKHGHTVGAGSTGTAPGSAGTACAGTSGIAGADGSGAPLLSRSAGRPSGSRGSTTNVEAGGAGAGAGAG